MQHLSELEACYAAMDCWARAKLIRAARNYAKNWPAPKKTALLTLVRNPAPVDVLSRGLDGVIDQHLSTLTRKTVDR
jgi:hypothetical protein